MSEQNFGLGKGITITTGFDLAAQLPLDSRTVVHDIDQLKALPADRVYLGLLVFVISENKLYQWKYNLEDDGVLSEEPDWGPIEAEVSAKEIDDLSEIDFVNTPSLQLEKNKNNFFPIVHEKFVYDDKAMALPDKYQTKIDDTLNTIDKSIVGSVNEINTKMDDTIEEFRKQIQDTIDNLNKSVEDMQNQTTADMTKMKTDLQEEINDILEELNRKSTELQEKVQDDVDKMMQDVDNVILSDLQVDELMRQININLAALDGYGFASGASFETYSSTIIVNTAVTEVSFESLEVDYSEGDKLFVHLNSVYLVEGSDYIIDEQASKIINITDEAWNSYNVQGCEFAFDLFKKIG